MFKKFLQSKLIQKVKQMTEKMSNMRNNGNLN
jgi:hypothetical protein